MVVGISIKDIVGAKAAMIKAIDMAQKDTKVIALHIPILVPEMMLSSISDPSDASEETFAALAHLPSKAGENLQKQIKEVAEDRMKSIGKEVPISYKVSPPTGDVKAGILAACRAEKADFLVVGPGVGGNGSIPPFVVQQAKGLTVCVVRDHVE
eukprot:CAMPEP_0179083666 /NCGR_PEP_ID=MMETSP0796-20121207/37794_1 /TAXON_ID=73915 /ORGANISM="Pyrodinium bahamense, Strain pbaha01" /LENGTH=153 /DNA_ID=CAMNT_0020781077 /DNA_START=115 /DNA_END=576 /DNA_ORIENTATION=+